MKKSILFLCLVSIFTSSCSKDDDTKTQIVQNYSVEIGSVCSASGGSVNTYCISKATYETIAKTPIKPCPYISFKTLQNQTKGGYLRSYSSTNPSCN